MNPAAMEEAASNSPSWMMQGVDVVRNQFGTLHHFEMLFPTAEFRVHQLPAFKIVEADTTLLRAELRHKFLLFRDA